jgi:hypothetical protein
MDIKKVVKTVATAYLAIMIVPPVINGTLLIAKASVKLIEKQIKKSEKIKDVKKDFEIKKQGVITVDYQEVDSES